MVAQQSDRSRRERVLPFSLQLLLATGIVLVISVIARQLTAVPAARELAAVRALEKLGCRVEWSEPVDEMETPFGTYRRSWFTGILGEKYFSNIARVRIGRPADEELAPYFEQLRGYGEVLVRLRGTLATDACVRRLAVIPRLRAADLALTLTTDAGVAELAAAEDLETLDLEHARVSDEAVTNLAAMPKLRELNLEGTHVSDEGVRRLKESKPHLVVTWTPAPSEPERAAAVELSTTLGIAFRAMRSKSGASVYAATVPSWTRSLTWPPPDTGRVYARAEVLKHLLRFPHLRRLVLVGGGLTVEDLDGLARLAMVRELYLLDGCSFITRGTAEHIVNLTSLRKLVLVQAPLGNRELELIGSLPQLEELILRSLLPYWAHTDDFGIHGELIAVDDDGLECLRRMPRLRRLVLRPEDLSRFPVRPRGEITDAGLAYVRTLPSLESLDLSGAKVSPAGLLRLRGMAKLRELVVLGVPIDAEQEKKLRRALPQVTIRTGPQDRTDSQPTPQRRLQGPIEKGLASFLRELDPIP